MRRHLLIKLSRNNMKAKILSNKEQLIVKDNRLINAAYILSLAEQRLVLLALIETRKKGKRVHANEPLTIHADHYAAQFGVTRQAAYWALKEVASGLFERHFLYESKDKEGNVIKHRSRWVSEIQYLDNTAAVRLVFTPSVLDLVTNLDDHFTSYDLNQISSLSSTYAMRLYELLVLWRSVRKTPEFKLEDLRNKLGVECGEYKRMTDFKRRVLDVAIEQINKYTDILVKYEQHKTGRIITGLSFIIGTKKNNSS